MCRPKTSNVFESLNTNSLNVIRQKAFLAFFFVCTKCSRIIIATISLFYVRNERNNRNHANGLETHQTNQKKTRIFVHKLIALRVSVIYI